MASPLAQLAHAVRVLAKRLAYEGVARDRWQEPDRVVHALGLQPGMRIADVGSGLGYFAFRFADVVGRSGIVYAVDTDPDLRLAVGDRAQREDRANVRPTVASPRDPGLPEPVDLVFLSAVFHHLPEPPAWFDRARRFLRPGGRVAILEARPEGFRRWFGHATSADTIRELMSAAGYRKVAEHDFLSRQSLQVFEPAGDTAEATADEDASGGTAPG